MRLGYLLPALALTFGLAQSVASANEPSQVSTIDHVLLWGRHLDETTSIMAVKLGFQVRPGRNPSGVENRFIRMPDRSYLELQGITRPDAEMDPGMRADQASLKGGSGSRMFGLRTSALDQVHDFLQQQGFHLTPMFSSSANDPDGAGPSKPPRWRLFLFDPQPLSTSLFFIDYPTGGAKPISAEDDRVLREHPNSARELSAVWLLSADVEADRKQLAHMGFADAKAVRMPQISARGYTVNVGAKQILLLQPDGQGVAADALRNGGPQVFGVSIGVTDIDRAQRWVERGYDKTLTSYDGNMGRSFLAPTQEDLGLLMEFHAMAPTSQRAR